MGILRRGRGRPFPDETTTLGKIAEWFIKPLIKTTKPESMAVGDFLHEIFHVESRIIKRYKVKRKIKIPGLYVEAPNLKIQGVGVRTRVLRKGHILLVRHDLKRPHEIEVCYFGGSGNKEHILSLDPRQWEQTLRNLEPLEDE